MLNNLNLNLNLCLRLAALSCVLLCAKAASFNKTGSFLAKVAEATQQLQCSKFHCAGGMSTNNNCCSGCCSDNGPREDPRRSCVLRAQCTDICVKKGGDCTETNDCCATFDGRPAGCFQNPANYTKCGGYSISFPRMKISICAVCVY